jgi:hypothetical protein
MLIILWQAQINHGAVDAHAIKRTDCSSLAFGELDRILKRLRRQPIEFKNISSPGGNRLFIVLDNKQNAFNRVGHDWITPSPLSLRAVFQ